MGCGTSFVKYVLFFFNLLVACVGLAMVGLGVAVLLKWKVLRDIFSEHNLNVAPWLFIVVGAIIFVIAFFGCCGAIRESHCMVVTYAIFLLVLIILQVVFAVLLFTYSHNIKDGLRQTVATWFKEAKNDNKVAMDVFSNLEQQLECCGSEGPSDYISLTNFGGAKLPESCCTRSNPLGDGSPCIRAVGNNEIGCKDKVAHLFKKWNTPIAGVAIGVACMEVVGALFALCLANSIRNMDRRSRY